MGAVRMRISPRGVALLGVLLGATIAAGGVFVLIGLGWALIVGGVAVAAIAAFGIDTHPGAKGERGRPPWVPQVRAPRERPADRQAS